MAKKSKLSRSQNIINQSTPFAVTEAYKATRTSLLFANTAEGCNIIVYTSSAPGEGKTVTCINTAISLAQSGKKVLLIDSDMRKPQIAQALKTTGVPGLSELLSGVVDIDGNQELCRQKTDYENLEILASGAIPPNPAELISGPRTKKLFDVLSSQYDYILIDTPPALVVTDALLYKEIAMGFVAVVKAGVSRIDATQKLLAKFEQSNARVIGFILNNKLNKKAHYKNYENYQSL